MDTHLCTKTEQDSTPDGAGPVPDLSGVKLVSQLEGMVTVFCRDEATTKALGTLLGSLAASGDIFCLTGDLGTGKTLLTKGLASALGVEENDVVSPSFSLLNVYEGGRLEVRHFDLYRLNSPEELADIGFYEYVGGDGVTVIEWADLFTSELPPDYLQVNLLRENDGRRVELTPRGSRYDEIVKEVLRRVDSRPGYSD
ncbi:MAG: tRNA (adenosine(37)-N6)-threonylcarbamoyltransferase complex ATPase subunit type 1 TsaE [Succiniclasticum sp.]|jgi:tRNA threonylcarbamoyladenosine biosynthesis protein TsaE